MHTQNHANVVKQKQSDIESLIECSFLLRENTYRRQHRSLQCHYDNKSASSVTCTTPIYPATTRSSYPHTYPPSPAPSSVFNKTTCTEVEIPRTNEDHDELCSADRFRRPGAGGSKKDTLRDDSDDEVPSLNIDESSVKSPSEVSSGSKSVASNASKSSNPYHRHMVDKKSVAADDREFSFPSYAVWDEQEQPVLLM